MKEIKMRHINGFSRGSAIANRPNKVPRTPSSAAKPTIPESGSVSKHEAHEIR